MFLLLPVVLFGAAAQSHEIRPGLLQMKEIEQGEIEYLWRKPVRADLPLKMTPVFPPNCRTVGPPILSRSNDFAETQAVLACDGGLRAATISIEGLRTLRTDVLVRIEYQNGGGETHRATPESPDVALTGPRRVFDIALIYLVLGVEHILFGIDHLLFVAALLMLVEGWRRLVATVTAFTIAHSITLAGATLGVLSAPGALIEALIALSIVFVAAEVIHKRRGETTWAIKRPWLIAFAFGLLHGFGFAGALSDVGLPEEAVPAALLFFNVGVEIGQLAFIAAVMIASKLFRSAGGFSHTILPRTFASLIGSVAGFWAVERVVAVWF